MSEESGYRIIVKGEVQNVGFRYSTCEKARSLGLRGLVKNLANGDVFIEVFGDETKIKAFYEWCKKGPPMANVLNLDLTPITRLEKMNEFRMMR